MKKNNNTALNSSILMVSASWLAKSLGLISTIILARLLTPQDFGLVAIVMLVIYFFNMFTETGCKQYLLSLKEIEDNDLNTAWTLNILSKGFISIIIILAAPYSSSLFSEPALTNSLYVAALIPIINGFENPAIYLAKRQFNYQGIFKLNVLSKIISFTITISLAYHLQSHWALIYGTITLFTLKTVGSYFIMPFTPSLSIKNINQQWNYSKWIFIKGFVGYARAKADTFILARSFSTPELGLFNIAKEFSMLLYEQIALPLADIVMTSVQKVKDNNEKVRMVIDKFSTLLVCLLLPAVIGLATLSEQITVGILGDKWLEAAPLLTALSILGFSSSLVAVLSATLNALSKTKLTFQLDLLTTSIVLLVLFFSSGFDILTFSLIRSLLGFIILIGYLLALRNLIGLELLSYFFNIIPALIASTIMYFALTSSMTVITELSIANLISLILIGAISYGLAFILILTLIKSKSEGLNFIDQNIHSFYKKLILKLKRSRGVN